MKSTEKIRKTIKETTNKQLLEMWEISKQDMSNEAIAVNAIIEAELESRNIIKFNEDTFEYEFVK